MMKKQSRATILLEVINNGIGFENLVWEVLLSRYVGRCKTTTTTSVGKLPWKQLGKDVPQEFLSLSIDSYHLSTVKVSETQMDICKWKNISVEKKENILYKCPNNSEAIDFCLFLWETNGVIAIQVSLSSLTNHKKPNSKLLNDIGISYYVFITTFPEEHINIANISTNTSSIWKEICVSKIRIVDANKWIGK